MKTLTALALIALISDQLAASAQPDQPTPHRWRGSHHAVHHRSIARSKTPAPAPAAAESAPRPADSMFKPYAHPGEGDDDGLSRDPDDCMKGCIGGAPG